jgi:hypothetical protein
MYRVSHKMVNSAHGAVAVEATLNDDGTSLLQIESGGKQVQMVVPNGLLLPLIEGAVKILNAERNRTGEPELRLRETVDGEDDDDDEE